MKDFTQETECFAAQDEHDHSLIVARLRREMPGEGMLEKMSKLFQCFADPTRMKILYALLQTELCVCAIAELLDMQHSSISHQLSKLRRARLVRCRKEGRLVIYSLADEHVRLLVSVGLEHLNEEARV